MIHVHEYGNSTSKHVIVLIPGIISTHDYWRDVIAQLDKNSRIISFDLLGFGKSHKPRSQDYSLDMQVEEVDSAIQSLHLPDGYILAGHSFGAMIALRLAATHTNTYSKVVLSGLPLINTITGPKQLAEIARCPEAIIQGPAGWVNAYGIWLTGPVVRLFIHKLFKDMPAHVIKDTTRTTPWALMRSIRSMLTYKPEEDIAANSHQTVLIFGVKDSITDDVRTKLGILPKNYQLLFYDCDHQIPLRMPSELANEIQLV